VADAEHSTHRPPAKVAGYITGVVLCFVFTWLLAVLGSVPLGSAVTIVVLVLFLGWTAIALVGSSDVET
jgi:hypothetical protein